MNRPKRDRRKIQWGIVWLTLAALLLLAGFALIIFKVVTGGFQ